MLSILVIFGKLFVIAMVVSGAIFFPAMVGLLVYELIRTVFSLKRFKTTALSPTKTNLIFKFLPEDCVANLAILKRRMKKRNISIWQIRWQLFQECVSLFFALYVWIPLENLILPSDDAGDRQIDD